MGGYTIFQRCHLPLKISGFPKTVEALLKLQHPPMFGVHIKDGNGVAFVWGVLARK